MTDKELLNLISIIIFLLIIGIWLWQLSRKRKCLHCGCKMRKAYNDWYCDNCGTLYHMNMFGKLKERKGKSKVMKVVIEINGVRHRLVENKQYISCTQCSLEKYCSRLCQEPYGGNTICAFFKLAGSYRFVKE